MRTVAALLALSAYALAGSAPPVIKPSPDFTVMEPSGKKITLSSQRGKVVVLAFMFTTCTHCQAEAQMLSKIYKDMEPRGLQVLGVAFNDNAAILVPGFVQQFGVNFPVGASDRGPVMSYLGLSEMVRWGVPQVVVIDKKGNIRAQTPVQSGDPVLQSEGPLRDLLETLLKEPTGAPRRTSHR
jgi:peroxiredoxin